MKRYTQIEKVRSTTEIISPLKRVRSTTKINSHTDVTNDLEINKPLVSILLAVYKPNEHWLKELLISLNNQTYENIELLIYDDCPEFPVNEECFKNYITKFDYTLIRGKENRGTTIAFEEISKIAYGNFLHIVIKMIFGKMKK